MKKILLSLTMVLAIVALASCSLTPQTTIEFSSLPETVYEAGEYTDADVEAFLEKVSVKVTGIQDPIKLTSDILTVSGFDRATLKTPGSYTLVVLFNSASVVFNYTVVAKETPQPVKNAEEFQAALNNGGIIELTANIETAKRFKITKSVVVYGNGYKVLSTEPDVEQNNGRAFDMDSVSNVKVSLNNLNVEATGLRGFSAYNCKNLEITLNNCTVKAANYAFNLASYNDGLIVNINETILEAYGAINIWSNNAEINVYKSVLKSEGHAGEEFGNIVLNGGARDVDKVGLKAGDTGQNNTINVVETEIIVNYEFGTPYVVLVQDFCSGNVINFEECSFTYKEGCFYLPDSYLPAANEVNVDGVRK